MNAQPKTNRFQQIAEQEIWRAGVVFWPWKKKEQGESYISKDNSRIVRAAKPTDLDSLFILLHEIGHHANRHDDGKDTTPKEEREANRYAFEALRRHGIDTAAIEQDEQKRIARLYPGGRMNPRAAEKFSRKNLFGFGKKTVTVHKTGGATKRQVLHKAFQAGQKSGDTGEFRTWVKKFEHFGSGAVREFEGAYRKGVERGEDKKEEKKERIDHKAEEREQIGRDVIEALVGLGMGRGQAKDQVKRLQKPGDSFEDLFRRATPRRNPVDMDEAARRFGSQFKTAGRGFGTTKSVATKRVKKWRAQLKSATGDRRDRLRRDIAFYEKALAYARPNPVGPKEQAAWDRAQLADRAFQKALDKKYGTRAGDMRYQTAKLPVDIQALARKYQTAIESWRKSKGNPKRDKSEELYDLIPGGGAIASEIDITADAWEKVGKRAERTVEKKGKKKKAGNPKAIATLSQGGAKAEVYRHALIGKKFRAVVTSATRKAQDDFHSVESALGWARLKLHELAEANPKSRAKNPMAEARRVYQEFHGFPSTEITEHVELEHVHAHTVDVGKLVCLDVIISGRNFETPFVSEGFRFVPKEFLPRLKRHSKEAEKAQAHWEFEDRTPLEKVIQVSCSEDRKQLFFHGGNQEIPVKQLGFTDRDIHDHMVIGEVIEITYETRKSFEANGKEEVDFHHEFGKQGSSGILPTLLYFPRTKRIKLAGGRYYIAPPRADIKASPGIVG